MKHLTTPLTMIASGAALTAGAAAQITFTPAPTATTGQRANVAAFGDFDGDGALDMAVTTDGNGVQDLVELHRGNGDGTFALAGSVLMPNSSSPHGLVTTDVDGDGDTDVVVGLADTGQVVLLSNLGGFAFAQTSSAATGGQESRSLVGGDLDGDGDMDFAMANRDSNDVSVVLNSGGTLVAAGRVPAGQEPRDVAIGDFDGDGIADLAASSHDDRTVRVLTGNGSGGFTAGQVLSVPAGTRPQGMAAADVDGDGDMDVLAGTGDDNNAFQNFVAVYTNTGAALTGPTAFPTGGLDAGDLVAADFDANGTIDVAVANETSGEIAVLSGNGAGGFAPATTLAPGGQPDTLAVADLDGNGSPDLASTRRQTAGVAVFRNDASAPIGVNYCTAAPNSSGQAATMSASGSAFLAQNDLTLSVAQMPAGVFGMLVVSRTEAFVPGAGGSQGNLCLGGTIGRYDGAIFLSGAAGQGSLAVDLTQIPQGSTLETAVVGDVWRFQCWFRDVAAGAQTSNYSDGFAVTVR